MLQFVKQSADDYINNAVNCYRRDVGNGFGGYVC